MIHLGYEVGTGEPVEVPLGHTIVCGQSQKAGKTTALEALAFRAGRIPVLAFRTKRGEGAFGGTARVVPPFFRERADWQFVEAILESTMKQRMRFERAWVMRATRGARGLGDVRRNVARLMKDAKRSMDVDMYMMLGEYLDIVVPAVARLGQTPPRLEPGANVMDLTGLATEVQGLVIATALEDVLAHRENVVSVVPEAWEFMPQGRNSPVRMAAAALARKGAALRNFLWVDSQDLAGVEKEVVRQAEVWLLGVQREANEVARALACIPAGVKKPKVSDITSLGLGQFWCCLPGGVARKVYVQPAWMRGDAALAVARGDSTAGLAAILSPEKSRRDQAELAARVEVVVDPVADRAWGARNEERVEEEDEMASSDAMKALERLTETVDRMIGKIDEVLSDRDVKPQKFVDKEVSSSFARTHGLDEGGEDALFARFRDRLLKDPKVIRVLQVEKRIDVTTEVEVIDADGKTLHGRVALLIRDGYFDEGRSGNQAWLELRRRGYPSKSNGAPTSLYDLLTTFAADGFLTVDGKTYSTAEGAKKRVKEKG